MLCATPACSSSKRLSLPHKERGATLVEFLLVLPVFLLILGGIVDFGLALRNLEVISEAVKQGAQAGALLSFPSYSVDAQCTPRCVSADLASLPDCDEGEEEIDCELSPTALECRAQSETQSFLLLLGMQPQDWKVSVKSCSLSLGSPGIARRLVVKNQIRRAENSSGCLLCLHKFFSSDLERAESSFFLTSGCTGFGEECI